MIVILLYSLLIIISVCLVVGSIYKINKMLVVDLNGIMKFEKSVLEFL